MSRHTFGSIGSPISFHTGNDHAIGKFIDITDRRYASSPDDMQGEGYVFEYSEAFGISTNLIGATLEDLKDKYKMIELVETFIKSKGYDVKPVDNQ